MRTSFLAFVALLAACDDGGPQLDPDLEDAQVIAEAGVDGAAPDAATPDGGPAPDRGLDAGGAVDATLDTGTSDASTDVAVDPDAAVDAAVDPPVDATADTGPADASVIPADADVAPDLSPPDADLVVDAGAIDAAPLPDGGPIGGFVEGEARAADGVTAVVVRVGDVRAQTDAEGRFRLGPLPPGPTEIVLSAPRHQSLTRPVDVEADETVALDEPVLLYRGRRIGPAAGAQLRFSFDGEWILWSQDDALWARGTAPDAAAVELLARSFEVFLGFVPGQPAVTVRRRIEVGLAGDIEVIQLADGARQSLFAEAQPWVRWRRDDVLGMVGTRDGLSTLVVGQPGAEPVVRGEDVPWLLVTELVDGELAWAQQSGEAFEIWRGGDAIPAEMLAPAGASDAFLMTTPGRTGLMWITTNGTLMRWEPDTGRGRVAIVVRASPRPRFIPQGLLYWRDDLIEPGLQRLYLLADGEERELIRTVDSATFRLVGDRYYVVRPEDGLWTGTLDGEPERLIAGERFQYTTQGQGVIALVDGEARWAIPGGAAVATGVDGLTTLQGLNVGATAWQSATNTLWWVPGPDQAAPPQRIVEGAPRARRVVEPGNAAVFALGPAGYFRAPIPPGMPQTMFAEVVTELMVLSAAELLGWQPDDWLFGIVPATGEAMGWAASVSRVVTSSNRRFVAYVSDRGTFLVDREE